MAEEQQNSDQQPDEQSHRVENKTVKKRKINLPITLSIILVLVLLINIGLIVNVQKTLSKSIEEAKEKNKPAEISLTVLKNPNCKDCFDINKIVETIKNNNVKVLEEKSLAFDSEEAKSLISKYEIQRIPSLIVSGQIDRSGELGLINKGDALIFENTKPIYFDIETNEEIGRVTSITIKDPGCKDCSDVSSLITQLVRTGVIVSKESTLDVSQAQELIAKYKITKIPTIIFSKDLGSYQDSQVLSAWKQFGSIEDDGSYILRAVPPPYKDLTKNEVVGLVDVTYLNDNSCSNCYNVSLHKAILLNFGTFISKENRIDISSVEGKDLLAKYKITKVPTIILTKEASAYTSLIEAWKQVGTVEDDGIFVFRNLEVLGLPYKDLTTNQVVEPKPQTQTTTGGN